jgi:2-amino-4-hydroxy-6-hydroxymethyldihydropteridine diphosphokinase
MEPAWRHATIGLGGNLGQPDLTLGQALKRLGAEPNIRLLKASDLWRTQPVDAEGPDFCNAVALVETPLSAGALLDRLLAIETEFGRERSTRNAPRTLDLDLLSMTGVRVSSSQLTVPHPRAHERAFVLVPLCQVAPQTLLGAASDQPLATATQWHGRLPANALKEIRPW